MEMELEQAGVETAPALAAVGLDPLVWQNVIARGHYHHHIPPIGPGKRRYFFPDDLAALGLLQWLLERRVQQKYAAAIASEFRNALERKQTGLAALYVVKIEDFRGRPHVVVTEHPPENGKSLWKFNVAEIRKNARRMFIDMLIAMEADGR